MKKLIVVTLASVFLVTGCSSNSTLSGDVYSAKEAKQVQRVTYGNIVSVRPVKIQSDSSGGETTNLLGTIGGAALGGILGSTIGGGKGNTLATAAGVLAGGAAGSALQNTAKQVNALEMEVKETQTGQTIIIVQAAAANAFYAGQPVRIITSNSGKVSVAPR